MALSRLLTLTCAVAGILAAPHGSLKQSKPQSVAQAPAYVLEYAPVVWIQSEDPYMPAPISSHLTNVVPTVDFTQIKGAPSPLTLDNLSELNNMGGYDVALSSIEDFTTFPAWLEGNKPDSSGKAAGNSSAAIIVVDKGSGTVDAFYMYFYSFNEGNKVFGTDAGNHVGDWEHNAIRFINGVPQAIWYSQHAGGEAFTYNAVEKHGKRPVTYAAKGSHANYGTAGKHDHTIPNLDLPFDLFLTDSCDQGTLWDPAANAYTYSYSTSSGQFTPYDGHSPVSWLSYQGTWGDDELPSDDPRQHYFLDIKLTAEWTGGPRGPQYKNLGRSSICPDGDNCEIKTSLYDIVDGDLKDVGKEVGKDIGDEAKKGAQSLGDKLKKGAKDLGDKLKKGAKDVGDRLKKAAEGLLGKLGGIFGFGRH